MMLQRNPFCEIVHPDDQQYVEESVRSLNIEHPHTNIFYRKRNPQGKWFYMQSDLSYLIVGKKKYGLQALKERIAKETGVAV